MARATAMVLNAPRQFERREFDVPAVAPNEGLLRVEACGLCGTDHEQYSGHVKSAPAIIPGHEVIGIVEDVGDDAAARWGVTTGQRVAVEVFKSCGECEPCVSGIYRRCVRNGTATMVGFTTSDTPARSRWRIRNPPLPGARFDAAAGAGRHGSGIRDFVQPTRRRHSLGRRIAGDAPGRTWWPFWDRVCGACASLRPPSKRGAEFVMITGLGARDAERLAIAPRFGVDLAVDVAETDPNDALRAAIGRKADVVVDVTAKAPTAFGQAVALARPGGTIVLAGLRGSTETPGLDPDRIVFKELRILGALGVDMPAYRKALEMLASNRYPFADLPRQIAGFDDIEPLLQVMAGDRPGIPPLHGVFAPQ